MIRQVTFGFLISMMSSCYYLLCIIVLCLCCLSGVIKNNTNRPTSAATFPCVVNLLVYQITFYRCVIFIVWLRLVSLIKVLIDSLSSISCNIGYPLKGRCVKWLHFARSNLHVAYILIYDIPAPWRSAMSAIVPECQKLKYTCRLDLDGILHF